MTLALVDDMAEGRLPEAPAGLKFNTKGLSPCPVELARLCAWRKVVEAELEILSKGRVDLDAHIDRLAREVAKSEADETASVENVLNRIREGLKWSIAPRQPSVDHSLELRVSEYDSPWPLGGRTQSFSSVFTLDANTNPPQWVQGVPLR
jgi:hypothetical protein